MTAMPLSRIPGKLVALLLIVACLVLGIAGLILPVIPGLLFLAIAAIAAARFFPPLDAALRSNSWMSGYMHQADSLRGTDMPTQLRLGGLMALKMLIESLMVATQIVSRLLRTMTKEIRRYV